MSAASRAALAALALTALTTAVYLPVLGHGFSSWDDPHFVTDNPELLRGLSPDGVGWAFTTFRGASWIPLTWLSFLAEQSLHGMSPVGAHATQLGLHVGIVLLLFAALRRMTGRTVSAAVVAGLLALHPVNVESVAWVSERKGLLAAFFWMLAIHVHAGRGTGAGSWPRRAGLLAASGAAMLSKPVAVTLPFSLLLLDFWPLRRWGAEASLPRSLWLRVREKAELFGLSACVSVITVVGQRSVGAVAPLEALGLGERLSAALAGYGFYLRSFFWPGQRSVFYPYGTGPEPAAVVASGLALALITGVAVWQWRARPWLATGWLWFLGTAAPTIGLVQVGSQAYADRYAYLPCVGLAIAVVWTLGVWAQGLLRRAVLAALATLVLLALALGAAAERAHWRSNATLFEAALARVGDDPVIHEHLGSALMGQGRVAEGREHLERSFAMRARVSIANNLAWSYATHPDPALRRPRRAVRLALWAFRAEGEVPEHAGTLAAALAARGRFHRAVALQQRAIELARSQQRVDLLGPFERRMDLYRGERPYVEPAEPPVSPRDES